MDNDTTAVDQITPLGEVLDVVLRKVSSLQLVDNFIGSKIDYPSSVVFLYFSDQVTQEQMEQLKVAAESDDYKVVIEEIEEGSEGNEGDWILKIAQGELHSSAQASDVPLSGEVSISIPSQGNVTVKQGGEPE